MVLECPRSDTRRKLGAVLVFARLLRDDASIAAAAAEIKLRDLEILERFDGPKAALSRDFAEVAYEMAAVVREAKKKDSRLIMLQLEQVTRDSAFGDLMVELDLPPERRRMSFTLDDIIHFAHVFLPLAREQTFDPGFRAPDIPT